MQPVRNPTTKLTYEDFELVKIHRRAPDGSFPRVAELTREASHSLQSPLFPGLEISLAELFA